MEMEIHCFKILFIYSLPGADTVAAGAGDADSRGNNKTGQGNRVLVLRVYCNAQSQFPEGSD